MGFISFVSAVVLMLFCWMAAGANAIANTGLTTNTVKAALAFDILTGNFVWLFLKLFRYLHHGVPCGKCNCSQMGWRKGRQS